MDSIDFQHALAFIGLQVGYWNANKMYQKEKSNDPRAKFKYNANQDLEKKDIEIHLFV